MKQGRITITEREAHPVERGARFARGVAANDLSRESTQEHRDTEQAAATFAEALEGAGGEVELEGPAEPLQAALHHALFDLSEELDELINEGPRTPFDQVAEKAELIAGLARKADGLEEVLS